MSDCSTPDHRHVGLQDRRQQVALRHDLLVHEVEVVADVAEVLRDGGLDVEQRAAREPGHRGEQRVHGAVEVAHLAAELVDALNRRGGAGEDDLLELLDVTLDLLDHRRVVVDDLVEDRPERRRRPCTQQLRALLQAQPGSVEVARRALAHGDQEAPPEEDRDLAELDDVAVGHVAGRAQDDERDAILVLLDLGAEVEALRVLDRELVQAEDLLHRLELLGRRLDHPEPDEAGIAAADRGRVLGPHRALVLPPALPVMRAIDDHGARSMLLTRFGGKFVSPVVCEGLLRA
jgi:hypothetical protein